MSTEATPIEDISSGAPASTGGEILSSGDVSTGFAGWADGWRSQMAAISTDSEKELKRLEMFESPEQIYKSYREMERMRSRGELKPTLPEKPTSEELSRWRKEMGIPAKPEEYKINLPAGKEVPEEDDPFLKAFLASAHEQNYTQTQVDSAIKSFYAEVDRQEELIAEAEKKKEAEMEDELRQAWGRDYRSNKAMAEALLARAPEGFRDRFMNGYLSDNTPIRASAEAWKWLVQMEREINPAATVVPGQGSDLGLTIDAEIKELKKEMANPNSSYWKGPEAEDKQERYRKLIEAQERIKAKTGTAA